MNWFPVDKHVRSDPKIRAIRRRFGPAGIGNLLELWSYVATEGSHTDEGRGVNRNGDPLNLDIMAADLDFPSVGDLRLFLDYLADVGHIDPDAWQDQGIVFLTSMNRRMEAYRISKGRRPTGRPVGRPRVPHTDTQENSGKSPAEFPDRVNHTADTRGDHTATESAKSLNNSGGSEIAGNSGVIPGQSGPAKITLPCLPDLILEQEDPDDQVDPRRGKLTPNKLKVLWNELRQPGPKVLKLDPVRRERLSRAIKVRPDYRDWETAITYLNGAAWANAPGGDTNTHGNFRADLDYLARPGNVTKALERLAAKNLPGARPARHTGRVAPTGGGDFRKAAQAQKAEDAAFRTGGDKGNAT